MGRKIPLDNNDPSQAFHQTLCVPLLLAGIAAVMALVSLLCGDRSRGKPESPSSTHNPAEKTENSPSISPPTAIKTQNDSESVLDIAESESSSSGSGSGSFKESQRNLLTGKRTQSIRGAFSSTNLLRKSASTQIMAKNLSTRMQRSVSMAGRDLQDMMNKGGKPKPEESVWMKTIILGEKCRVEDGEEAIIYERKGNKISAYHPKSSGSFIHHSAIRSRDEQRGGSVLSMILCS